MFNLDLEVTLEGLLSARVPQNQPKRVHFRDHLKVHEGQGGVSDLNFSTRIAKKNSTNCSKGLENV